MVRQVIALGVLSLLLAACGTIPASTPVVGTSALMPTSALIGAPEPSSTLTPTLTPTSAPTKTPEPTSTLTAMPTPAPVTVDNVTFHDLNGDSTLNSGEPVVPGVEIKLVGHGIERSCVSDSSGLCSIVIPAGIYTLMIDPPSDSYFEWLCVSSEQEIPLERGRSIEVSGETLLYHALLEGPYRNPFPKERVFVVDDWVDIDRRSCDGEVGDRTCPYRLTWRGNQATYDYHDGTDFRWDYRINTGDVEVYPMRAGRVQEVVQLAPGEGWGILIRDDEPFECSEGLSVPFVRGGTSYQAFFHLQEIFVSEGDRVTPETLIGRGPTKIGEIHINQYICVPPGVHPASPYRANTYVPTAFGDRLWTGRGAFPELWELYSPDGSLNGTLTRIW